MIKKVLIGILVVLGLVVAVLNQLVSTVLAVAVWIYLVRMVRKQKSTAFNDLMAEGITKLHLKRLKTLLIVAGFSFIVFIFASVAHNVLHGQSETEETTFFLVALVALLVFIVATVCGMVIFLKTRKNTTQNASVDTKCLTL